MAATWLAQVAAFYLGGFNSSLHLFGLSRSCEGKVERLADCPRFRLAKLGISFTSTRLGWPLRNERIGENYGWKSCDSRKREEQI
jgi:hypothetical protein